MRRVWTRTRAGTDSSADAAPATGRELAPLVSRPVPERPQIHAIELPLPDSPSWGPRTTRVYLIEGEPLTLVDTGVRSEASRAALEAALEAVGRSLGEIERIVVTHAHRDHFGLAETIRAAGAGLEVCVHEADAAVLERFESVLEARIEDATSLFRDYGVPAELAETLRAERREALASDLGEAQATRVDRILREGDRIASKDGEKELELTVRHSPGHTPGHLLLEDVEAGVLFTGDQVMARAVPNAENFQLDAPPDPSDPARRRPRFRGLDEMRRSLRRLRSRTDRFLLPGYGPPIVRAQRTIRDTLLFYEVRIQRIERGLRQLAAMGQDVTAFELWEALYAPDAAHASPVDVRAQLLLVIGALDCLEEDGSLETLRREDGVLVHHHR